jgi:hypothetical protein
MSQPAPGRLPYELDTIIQCTPPASGVYALFCRAECVGIGASDDICASLLESYYTYDPRLDGKQLTHFTFDLVPPEYRVDRMTERIRELGAVCTLGTGFPDFDHRRLAQGEERQTGRRVADAPTQAAHR